MRRSILIALAVTTVVVPSAGAPPVKIVVPHGFQVSTFAAGLEHPTAMAWGPDSRLYVTEDTGLVVVAARGSHKPLVVARGLSVPLGLAWQNETLFVSEQGRLTRFTASRVDAHRPARCRARPALRAPSAGQRRPRLRRAPLHGERIDLRCVQGEEPAQRDGALAAPRRKRSPHRRARNAQPLRPGIPARNGASLCVSQRTGQARDAHAPGAGRDRRRV